MGNIYSQNLRFVVGKLETTPGTAETLVDADYDARLRVPEVAIDIPMDDENSKFATGDHSEDAAIPGAQMGTIGFQAKAAWGGAVTTEPAWWKFANGCGAKKVTYTTTGIALQPMKEFDDKTMTIEVIDIQLGATPKGKKYLFAGCMGTWALGADGIGMPWINTFGYTGKLVDISDVANGSILDLTSPDTTIAERLLSNTMTYGGVAQCISSFSLDTGNTINPFICQSEATGYKHFAITERRPRFNFNPLQVDVATEDTLDIINSSTDQALILASTNMELKIANSQLMSAAVANREGYVNWDHTLKALRNTSAVDSNWTAEAPWQLLIGARA